MTTLWRLATLEKISMFLLEQKSKAGRSQEKTQTDEILERLKEVYPEAKEDGSTLVSSVYPKYKRSNTARNL